jgi:glycosyltransferase involved in cell wall biosynthesis
MGPLLRRTSCVVTHSYTLKACLETTYNLTNVCVIPNAVDDLWFESDNNSFDRNNSLLDENSFKIFYHGRLSPEKGVDLLIETLSIYSKMNPKSVLYIAGDGPFKTYLRGLSKKLNVEKHVVFLGVLSASEIKHCLKEADIAIYPSRFDNFPLAMLEAFACAECPVVLSSNSGICDFIRKDGYYFETINPNKSEILKSILNANQLNENIKYQKQFAQKYKWKYIMHKYIALYRYIEKN